MRNVKFGMMKKLKWSVIIAIVVSLIVGYPVIVNNIRISAEEAKQRNYLRAEADRELKKKMELIQFENIEFIEDTTPRQATNFLALRLRESDPPSPFSAQLVSWRDTLSDEIKQKSIGKLGLKSVSLAEVMDVLFLRCGLSWEIINGELVVGKIKKEGNAEAHLKLDRVKLEILEFTEDTTMRQAINFLRLRARELDDGVPISRRGLGFVSRDKSVEEVGNLELDDEEGVGFQDQEYNQNRMIGEISMQQVSLREALTVICRRGRIKWHVGESRVIFSNRED